MSSRSLVFAEITGPAFSLTAVPLPGAIWFLGGAVAALGLWRRRPAAS